ncbi:Ribonuclease H2 subunit B [Nakaseomyces bracarensis]|uniref:Ribonuclease H2 subunit B n=1 Tax=Nakaseomyces bracarensis TaxID=273131 RepID=A0ABR4NSA3_9SACH
MSSIKEEETPDGIYFLPNGVQLFGDSQLFSLQNPSNIKSKGRVTLLIESKEIYQVSNYKFGQGRKYERTKDEINDRYHYDEQGKPLRSAIMVQEDDKTKYEVLPTSTLKLLTKYDLGYNLISYKFKESQAINEKEYVKDSGNNALVKDDNKYLTLRDYADYLVDTCDKNWEHVPMDILATSLSKISETIEEAGDTYYKITIESVLKYLSGKVINLVQNFPNSLKTPSGLDDRMQLCFKIFMSVNILISLIPKFVYQKLRSYEQELEGLGISIETAFEGYQTFTEQMYNSKAEEALLLESATTVGLGGEEPVKNFKKAKPKTTAKKPKVAFGRGAIDGFFKKK